MAISLIAPAKLNINLKLSGKRDDGYHQLISLAGFTEFGDKLHLAPASKDSLEMDGNIPAALQSGDNLISLAVESLRKNGFDVPPTQIRLEKYIPVGGGLGGGSTDAATTMRGLIQLYDLQIPLSKLHEVALALGADVPVCLLPNWYIMSGIGEILTPLSLNFEAPFVVLANPGTHVSTAKIFTAFNAHNKDTAELDAADQLSVDRVGTYWSAANWTELISIGNDLTAAAKVICPEIGMLLADIEMLSETSGYLGSAMSGSGASCFALFNNQTSAESLVLDLTRKGYWAIASRMHHNSTSPAVQ